MSPSTVTAGHSIHCTHLTQCCQLHYTRPKYAFEHFANNELHWMVRWTHFVCNRTLHWYSTGPLANLHKSSSHLLSSPLFCNYMQSRKLGIIHRAMCAFLQAKDGAFLDSAQWCLVHTWKTNLTGLILVWMMCLEIDKGLKTTRQGFSQRWLSC